MATSTMITNISSHMSAFLMSHGGIDMDQFYEDHSDVTVEDIIESFTSLLMEAVEDEDNQSKLKKLTKAAGKPKEEKPTKEEKSKEEKPKRSKTAYNFFCSEYSEQAKSELLEEADGEKLPRGAVLKRLGEWWKEMEKDEDRKEEYERFVEKAREDKERCNAAKPKAKEEKPKAKPKAKGAEPKAKPKAKEEKPNAKPNAFNCFCEAEKATVAAENPEMSQGELKKELLKLWQSFDQELKDEWKELAELEAEVTEEGEEDEGEDEGEKEGGRRGEVGGEVWCEERCVR